MEGVHQIGHTHIHIHRMCWSCVQGYQLKLANPACEI